MKTLVALLLVSTLSFSAHAKIHALEDMTENYDFGEVTIGQGASNTWEFTAEKDMYITSVTLNGKDFWAETDCLGELDATYTCYFELNFDPTEVGDYTGTAVMTTDTDTFTLNITGKGVEAAPAQMPEH
ncbi:MAG: hypothetical protein J7501_02085 [Bdellovibrio sp.]|nr:hypothetical protein [Bdellovibrio sp.]